MSDKSRGNSSSSSNLQPPLSPDPNSTSPLPNVFVNSPFANLDSINITSETNSGLSFFNTSTSYNNSSSSNSSNNTTTSNIFSTVNGNTLTSQTINSSHHDNNSSTITNSNQMEKIAHGHFFSKKSFHKPTYCHHCTEMLWGLIGQGLVCEVCNFVCHDKCQKFVVSPCSSIAPTLIKNPVPHCWSEPSHFKRKFCNVCRKRLEDSVAVRCEICEYYVHVECQVLAVCDCLETATYVPHRELRTVTHFHHWREGNLPANSKCIVCKKTCWSAECLAGMKCEWCGITVSEHLLSLLVCLFFCC